MMARVIVQRRTAAGRCARWSARPGARARRAAGARPRSMSMPTIGWPSALTMRSPGSTPARGGRGAVDRARSPAAPRPASRSRCRCRRTGRCVVAIRSRNSRSVHVVGMRVEPGQHALQRAGHHLVGLGRLDIAALDLLHRPLDQGDVGRRPPPCRRRRRPAGHKRASATRGGNRRGRRPAEPMTPAVSHRDRAGCPGARPQTPPAACIRHRSGQPSDRGGDRAGSARN